MFELTKAFYPPGKYEPEYVVVTYQFSNQSVYEDRTWFWSKSIAYYIFPMNVLQKLSLFLSKGEEKYQQQVRVSLNATKCWKVRDDYMMLLTQRVSALLEKRCKQGHLHP